VKIAAVLPLTGKAQAYGKPALKGVRLGIKEVNAGGGVLGRPIALDILDNKSTPIYAKKAAKTAIAHGVSGVIGSIWSTHSLAMAPSFQKAHIPVISPGSTAPEVTRIGDYVFRICYTDDFQGLALARFARNQLHIERAAILVNISETYSQKLADRFDQAFRELGGSVVSVGRYKGSAADFRSILDPLLAMSPGVVFIPGYTQESGLIIRQASGLGIHTVFIGGDAWEKTISDVAGPGIVGSMFSTFWHPEVPNTVSRRFVARYHAEYGKGAISPYAALAYDAVRLMADAMRRAGTTDGPAVRKALAATNGFPATTGRITFDGNGDPQGADITILKYTNDSWQFLATINNSQSGK